MFWNWKVTYGTGGFAPFMDAVDATGAGGGADLSDAGDGSQPSGDAVADEGAGDEGAAAGDDAGREEALEDLLLDEDEDGQAERSHEERLKAVAKKNRKLKRQLAKLLPLSERLKGVDLDRLVARAQQYDDLSAQIRSNPKLRALIHGDADEPEKGRRTPAAEPEEQFDESKLPWDPNESPVNRRMTDMARESFELRKQLKQLQARIDGVDGRETARTEAQVRDTWKTTILSATAQIKDDGVATVFRDVMIAAYENPKVRGKYTPQQLVSHYLKVLKINPAEAAKANAAAAKTGNGNGAVRTAATQQRIAEQNKSLPRTVATNGSPAPARSDKPTLGSLRKQVAAAGRSS